MLFCNINEAFNITNINDTSTEIIDNSSIENFVETEIHQKQEPLKKEKIKVESKLTHRSCLSIYFNPENVNQQMLECALKHIHKCNLCKENITKYKVQKQQIS